MSARRVFTLLKQTARSEVRHLLIGGSPSATTLTRLDAAVQTPIATGTEHEMRKKAEELARDWIRNEGFQLAPEGEPVFEPLGHTIALATVLGFTHLYDSNYKNLTDPRNLNPTGAVDLAAWSGLTPKSGGGYAYALDGLTIIACPTLPPDHNLNLKFSKETLDILKEAVQLQKRVGPTLTFVLGRAGEPEA
jgi:hypothetical protein